MYVCMYVYAHAAIPIRSALRCQFGSKRINELYPPLALRRIGYGLSSRKVAFRFLIKLREEKWRRRRRAPEAGAATEKWQLNYCQNMTVRTCMHIPAKIWLAVNYNAIFPFFLSPPFPFIRSDLSDPSAWLAGFMLVCIGDYLHVHQKIFIQRTFAKEEKWCSLLFGVDSWMVLLPCSKLKKPEKDTILEPLSV